MLTKKAFTSTCTVTSFVEMKIAHVSIKRKMENILFIQWNIQNKRINY